MKYIQNRTNWCWVAACKVAGEQYKKNFTEFAFTLENSETEVAVSNLDGLRTDIVRSETFLIRSSNGACIKMRTRFVL